MPLAAGRIRATGQDQLEPGALAPGGRRRRNVRHRLQSRRPGRRVLVASRPTRAQLAALIDHTLLKPEATRADVEALVAEAADLGVYAVCVSPSMVRAASHAAGAGLRVAAVAGFPSG